MNAEQEQYVMQAELGEGMHTYPRESVFHLILEVTLRRQGVWMKSVRRPV